MLPDIDFGVFSKADGSWIERGADELMIRVGLGLDFDGNKKHINQDKEGFTVWHYWAESPSPENSFKEMINNFSSSSNNLSNKKYHPLFFITLRDLDLSAELWVKNIKNTKLNKTYFGDSFWHALAWSNEAKCYEHLKSILNINEIDSLDGDNLCPAVIALHRSGGQGVLKWLEFGSNPNIKDHHGRTLLHHTALYGNDDLYELVLDCGADDTMLNDKNQKPYDVLKLNRDKSEKEISTLKQHWAMRAFMKNSF